MREQELLRFIDKINDCIAYEQDQISIARNHIISDIPDSESSDIVLSNFAYLIKERQHNIESHEAAIRAYGQAKVIAISL